MRKPHLETWGQPKRMRSLSIRSSLNLVVPLLTLIVATTPTAPARGQNLTTAGQTAAIRDASAVAIVQQAVAAMGGLTAASALQDAKLQGTFAPASGSGDTGTFSWEYSFPALSSVSGAHQPLAEFRNQVHHTGANAGPDTVLASGHGTPATSILGAAAATAISKLSIHSGQPFSVPVEVLARELADSNISIKSAAPLAIGAVTATHVRLSFDALPTTTIITRQEWYFDPASGLPLRVVYPIPTQLNAAITADRTRDFANWISVEGLLVPSQVTLTWGAPSNVHPGAPTGLPGPMVYTVSNAVFNSGIPSTDFDLPIAATAGNAGGQQ